MGKAIVEAMVPVLIAVIAAVVIIYFRRRQGKEAALDKGWATKGDLNARQERALIAEVELAAALFRQLLAPPTDLVGEMTFLRYEDRRRVEDWLHNHIASSANNTRRVIKRS
jgi:hypothetical protein